MNNFDATTFGVKGDGATDDTDAANAALAAAWAAAAKYPSSLHYPAGRYIMSGPLAPPGPLIGNLSIFGDPGDCTQFLFVNPTDGLRFDLSTGTYPFLNTVATSDLAILAGAACGCPYSVDYGIGNGTDTGAETNRGSSMRRVSIGAVFSGRYVQATPGAGWTCGPKFNVCHALTLEDLFLYGCGTLNAPAVAGAPGSGNPLHLSSCINPRIFGVYMSQWNSPILLDNAGNGLTDCQGAFFGHIRGVSMGALLTALGTPAAFPNGLADISITDAQLDNSYSGNLYQGGVDIEYGSDIKIDGLWAQASNGGTMVRINGSSGVKISKCKLYAGMPLPIVLFTGGTSGSFIEGGNIILGNEIGVQIDKGSPNNKIERQGIGTIDPKGQAIANFEVTTIFA